MIPPPAFWFYKHWDEIRKPTKTTAAGVEKAVGETARPPADK